MADKVFLIRDGGSLMPMPEQTYKDELDLQTLLATHVDLLPGEQMNPDAPRRWLLVTQEMPVPESADDGADRWSLDHLFLDQDGVPTLVETKRSSDTRLRREVVGQILEYAANAVVYWPVDRIRSALAATCAARGDDPDAAVQRLLDPTATTDARPDPAVVDSFWQLVRANLASETIRLVLVADKVPPETRRIIEFLNGQMARAEILAVELRQFVGDRQRVLVPQVLGQSEKAVRQKSAGRPAKRVWDEPSYLAALATDTDPSVVSAVRDLMAWARTHGLHHDFSGGAERGSFNVYGGPYKIYLFRLMSTGKIGFGWAELSEHIYTNPTERDELLKLANSIPGMAFSIEQLSKSPERPITDLLAADGLARIKEVFADIQKNVEAP